MLILDTLLYCMYFLSQESVIEIEVIVRNPPPSLSEEVDHKDWVSAVHCNDRL